MTRACSLLLILLLASAAHGQGLMALAPTAPESTADPILQADHVITVAASGTFDHTPTVTQGSDLTFDIVAGTLPSPLTEGEHFSTSTGQLTGTVGTGYGNGAYTVRATNSANETYDQTYCWHQYTSTANISDTGDVQQLDTNGCLYTVTEALTTLGTCLSVTGDGIAIDLNDQTVTGCNAVPIPIDNHSFETVDAVDADLADGWDFTGAPNATRFAGDWTANEIYFQDGGSYSLRFNDTTATEEVVCDTQITLLANTTYSLTAMFEYGPKDTANPGSTAYVTLDGDTDRTLTRTGGNNRGIQYDEYVFTTGGTNETYTVRVGITGHASSVVPWYIDSIKVQRHMQHAIVVGPSVTQPNTYTPDLSVGGQANNCTIYNGTITQGQGAGTWSHGVFNYQRTGLIVEDVAITVDGANSSCVTGDNVYNKYAYLLNNAFTSNVDTIDSRDNYHGTMVNVMLGEFADNTFLNGPHAGISGGGSQTTPYKIYRNTFSLTTRYTNAFAIRISDPAGIASHIHHNTIDSTGASYASAGIMTIGVGPSLIYNNDVNVKLLENNQEYGGAQRSGAFALQLEDAQNKEVYDNSFTVTAGVTGGSAARFSSGNNEVAGNNIHDNIFSTVGTSTNGEECLCFSQAGIYSAEAANLVTDNTFNISEIFAGNARVVEEQLLEDNTFNFTGDSEDFFLVEVSYYDGAPSTWHVNDFEFRDNIYGTGGVQALFEASGLREYRTHLSEDESDLSITWTTTIQVNDSGDQPIEGATVVIDDGLSAEVYSGTTDANGQCVTVLTQQSAVGTTITSHNNHTVYVSASGEGFLPTTFTANATQTITVTATGIPNFTLSNPTTDGNGVDSWDCDSDYNGAATTVLRVLEPDNPAVGMPHRICIVIPVEPGLGTTYGDGLEEIRTQDYHNDYNMTLVAPSFAQQPWIADHPTDADIRYDTFVAHQLVQWVRANYGAPTDEIWVLGFSKSGYSAFTLLMRHPDTFAMAACWDFPATAVWSTIDALGGDETYGTEANFTDNYSIPDRLTGWLSGQNYTTAYRIWISGDTATFTAQVASLDGTLTTASVLHEYDSGETRAHTWTSGWLPVGLAQMQTMYEANNP